MLREQRFARMANAGMVMEQVDAGTIIRKISALVLFRRRAVACYGSQKPTAFYDLGAAHAQSAEGATEVYELRERLRTTQIGCCAFKKPQSSTISRFVNAQSAEGATQW
jgi:hypothetical protein